VTQTLAPPSPPGPTVRRAAESPVYRTRAFARPLQYLALLGYVLFLGFPLLFLLSTSLKTPQELQSPDPSFFPSSPTWSNFGDAISKANLVTAAGNSLYVATLTTVIVTVISLPAAYALARFRTRLRGIATGWILLSQVFPFILIVIPVFLVLKQVGLVNNPLGLVLVYTVWCLPFALWMLRGYVAAIPVDLEEAGAIDGAGRLRVLRSIVLPLLAPGLVATSLFTFISSWNEFFFALVLIQDPGNQTLPLTLARFVGAEGQVQLGQLAAASLMATIPSLVFFLIIQRRLTSGLMSGAVKG
jgi:multiple sugar transport system permease protein